VKGIYCIYKVRRKSGTDGKNQARGAWGEQATSPDDANSYGVGEPQRHSETDGHQPIGTGGSNRAGQDEPGFDDATDPGKILEQVIDEIAAELKETRSKEARLAIRLAELRGLRDRLAEVEVTEEP
jgi:hypothetical protein